MSKREHPRSSGAVAVDDLRVKRRRDTVGSSSDMDITMSDPVTVDVDVTGGTVVGDPEVVKEQGLTLWQTVKDAVNKEGRALSLDFLRKPSKRLYADYYVIIKQPIALDDIKKKIDNGGYASLEEVRQDFELCFSNAKQYNMKDSPIWKDAKELLKLTNKTYNKLAPSNEDGGDGEDEKGKSKAPNLNRLIKSRLQKLVDKTDPSGRTMSTVFMELPSKKEWAIYYKEIKKPQCLENIFKRIKRKEYASAADFAADVELVFSNAMTFNQEHTPIWEDALALKKYFHQLMADLPPPFSIPEYTKPSNKIKIKPQATQLVASTSTPSIAKTEPATSSLLLRVPANTATKAPSQPPAPSPTLNFAALPASNAITPASSVATVQPPKAPTKSATPQPIVPGTSFINSTASHYPHAAYKPPISTSSTPIPTLSTPILRPNSILNAHSTSNSPAPIPLHPSHQLKSVSLRIQPRGRLFNLNHQDGVKSWAVRLVPGETGVVVADVSFLGDPEEESSGDEDGDHDENEDEMEVDVPVKNGRKKGKGKGKARVTRSSKASPSKVKAVKKKVEKVGEVQLKVNGLVVKEQPEQPGEWNVHLPLGSNTLEVGEVGGLIWKDRKSVV